MDRRSMYFRALVFLALATLCALARADTYRLLPIEPGQATIQVPTDPGWYLVITYEGSIGGQQFVYVAPPGEGPTPNPTPPGPQPNPPTPPSPPEPSPPPDIQVPNEYGVGRLTYAAAREIARPEQARAIADIYSSNAAKLVSTTTGDGDAADVSACTEAIRRETDALLGAEAEAWNPWRDQVAKALSTVWKAGKTKDRIAGALIEIEKALKLAAPP